MDDPNIIYGGDFENNYYLNLSSIGELILKNLKLGGSKHGFINGQTGESWSYDEILKFSIKISQALNNVGVKQNDIISIVAENCHQYMTVACGTFLMNAILAPFNYTYTKRELKHAFELINPKIVFVSSSTVKNVGSLSKEFSYMKHIITIDNSEHESAIPLKKFIENYSNASFDLPQRSIKAIDKEKKTVIIFQSSGTTGLPKGVEITHMNILSCKQGYNDDFKYLKPYGENLSNLGIAPWSHVMGFMGSFFALLSPERVHIFLPKFEGETYLKCLEKYKVKIIAVPPPIIVFLTKTPLFDKYDLTNLRVIFSGAAPLAKDVELAAIKRFNNRIIICQGYGMSETTLGVTGTFVQLKHGSVGKVGYGMYAKVIDSNGKSLGPNKVGELCFKGSRIMKGYFNNAKATAETIDKDGWLHTGDLGYFDNEHQFFIVDRLKELIKYKAFQVAPAEIEGLLLSHPKIKDAGVIGIPNNVVGELPFAFVVKLPEVELTEKEVQDFIKENASNAKWLRGGVKFVDEIPKNPSGKILRRELREAYKISRAKL
ncbi:hypothetical protein PVAND_004478 [Polypedilum vanderplanki]|uniref:Luciferin 4-monooxygenase n=1 Tax=Polypedilum vanderplanki TaxID=319348 RepID=A0A9J6BXA0_POLVA|nr:hypothetical protein PVAND_004478 [Polypedilum vanderplanki]